MTKPPDDHLAAVLARLYEFTSGDTECGYLPGRLSRHVNFIGGALRGSEYRALLDANFRRAGVVFYRPECAGCRACRQIRVLVREFTPTKSQRRSERRNLDLTLSIGPPELDEERADLYRRYVEHRHEAGPQTGSTEELESFLYRSAVPTLEIAYRNAAGHLIGVSILDVGPGYFSSVYHYFDPTEEHRSLGVFSVLAELELARARGLDHYYLGYWIPSARTMAYKANYRPFEILVDGEWKRVGPGDDVDRILGATP